MSLTPGRIGRGAASIGRDTSNIVSSLLGLTEPPITTLYDDHVVRRTGLFTEPQVEPAHPYATRAHQRAPTRPWAPSPIEAVLESRRDCTDHHVNECPAPHQRADRWLARWAGRPGCVVGGEPRGGAGCCSPQQRCGGDALEVLDVGREVPAAEIDESLVDRRVDEHVGDGRGRVRLEAG